MSLRERMLKRLEAARFRQVNEELDSMNEGDPKKAFGSNIEQFKKYHETYRDRVQQWPKDPLDIIIKFIKKKIPKDKIIADFGCGDARLSLSVPHTVHSFDLFALNDRVTACDMSQTPLKDQSVDVAVFSLSLMGTEIGKYIGEANRVLRNKGLLKIAEVTSRFPNGRVDTFTKKMKKFGFVSKNGPQEAQNKNNPKSKKEKSSSSSSANEVFVIIDFIKVRQAKIVKGKLPTLNLEPSLYKKR